MWASGFRPRTEVVAHLGVIRRKLGSQYPRGRRDGRNGRERVWWAWQQLDLPPLARLWRRARAVRLRGGKSLRRGALAGQQRPSSPLRAYLPHHGSGVLRPRDEHRAVVRKGDRADGSSVSVELGAERMRGRVEHLWARSKDGAARLRALRGGERRCAGWASAARAGRAHIDDSVLASAGDELSVGRVGDTHHQLASRLERTQLLSARRRPKVD
eukprot:scaffold34134_cov31-Tisochrysis_lutea.AAC.3